MLKQLLTRLRGGSPTPTTPAIAARETYRGFEILAMPRQEDNTWRVAGRVMRGHGDDARQHDFVRADTYAGHDDAVQVSLRKGQQIVDEFGAALFD